MKKQILNAILINSNYQIKDVGKTLDNRKQNLIIFFMMSIISFILLIFMFPHFLSIIYLFLFIILATLTRALYKELELIRILEFIYENYPQLISFIAQNISEFNKIDKNKITSYNWLDNQHYLNYLIQKKDLEGFKKFLPIFMNEKYITFDNKPYRINNERDLEEMQKIIKTIDNLKSNHPNITYPEYSLDYLTKDDLNQYYNVLLKTLYEYEKV